MNAACRSVFSTEVQAVLSDLHSADLERVETAEAKLKEMERASLWKEIAEALSGPDPHIRVDAAEIIGIVGVSDWFERVLPLFQDPDDSVRFNWFSCLLGNPVLDRRLVEPSIQTLMNDPDADVRALAVVLLGRIGDPRAIPALRWAATHDSGMDYEGMSIRALAINALVQLDQKV